MKCCVNNYVVSYKFEYSHHFPTVSIIGLFLAELYQLILMLVSNYLAEHYATEIIHPYKSMLSFLALSLNEYYCSSVKELVNSVKLEFHQTSV